MPSTVLTLPLIANEDTTVNFNAPSDGRVFCVAIVYRSGASPISVASDGRAPARAQDHRTSVLHHRAEKTLAKLTALSQSLHLWSQESALVDLEVTDVPIADADITMRRGQLADVCSCLCNGVWPDAA